MGKHTDADSELYVVEVDTAHGPRPVLHRDAGGFTLDRSRAAKHPHGHMTRATARAAHRWATKHGHKVRRILKAKAYEATHGDLRLAAGQAWPTDHRTVDRLRQVAGDIGRPLLIVSGKRSLERQWELYRLYKAGRGNLAAYPSPTAPHIAGYAADVDIVHTDGSLESIGLDAHARAALWRRGLVLQVPSEAWHVAPREISPWRYWQKP